MFYPFMLCIMAGLATGAGGLAVAVLGGITDEKMSFSQGFAAGVMLTVSLADLAVESFERYYSYMPAAAALRAVVTLMLTGWIAGGAIGGLVLPHTEGQNSTGSAAGRVSAITFLVMVLHNLPEGVLTVFTATRDSTMGLRMAVAVALHNLPEGIAVAAPVLYLTGSRTKAFLRSLLAGLAEPVGGIGVYLLLKNYITLPFINGVMPVVGGIMCQAALCELLPSAVKLSDFKHTICGTITGIAIMSIGLLLV